MDQRDPATGTILATHGALGLRLAYAITGVRETAERVVAAAAERCETGDWLTFLSLVREESGRAPAVPGPDPAPPQLGSRPSARSPAGVGSLPVDPSALGEAIDRLAPEDRTTLLRALLGRDTGQDAADRLATALCALRERITRVAFPSEEDIP